MTNSAIVTRDGLVLGAGRVLYDSRDWPQVRDARIDALIARLGADGWHVSDHRTTGAVVRWSVGSTFSGHLPRAA